MYHLAGLLKRFYYWSFIYKNMRRLSPWILFVVTIFAGCAKPQPTLRVLETEVKNKMPKHLNASIAESRLSPMKELSGTTLPEGSWQADLKITISPKETLYVACTPIGDFRFPAQAENAVSEEVRSQVLAAKPLLLWDFQRKLLLPPDSPKGKQSLYIAAVATPSTRKDVWIKLLTEPRGKEWEIRLLDGDDPTAIYYNGHAKSDFGAGALVWGSPEQVEAVRLLEKEKADDDAHREAERLQKEKQRLAAEQHAAKVERLRPEVNAIREKESALAQKYSRQVQEKLDDLQQEYIDKNNAFERYKSLLFNTTPDVAERNSLTEKATRNWYVYAAEVETRRAEIQKGFRAADLRAKKETRDAVETLCKEAGIDTAEFGF